MTIDELYERLDDNFWDMVENGAGHTSESILNAAIEIYTSHGEVIDGVSYEDLVELQAMSRR